MAGRQNTRRLPAVMLVVMALILVHSARVPMIKTAGASTDVSGPVKNSDGKGFISPRANGNGNSENHNTSTIQTLLTSMAIGSPAPATAPLPWALKSDPQARTAPVDLIPLPPDNGTAINTLGNVNGAGLDEGSSYMILPGYHNSAITGDEGLTFDPGTPRVTTATTHRKLTVSDAVPSQVPEPASISLLIGGWLLVRRRRPQL